MIRETIVSFNLSTDELFMFIMCVLATLDLALCIEDLIWRMDNASVSPAGAVV